MGYYADSAPVVEIQSAEDARSQSKLIGWVRDWLRTDPNGEKATIMKTYGWTGTGFAATLKRDQYAQLADELFAAYDQVQKARNAPKEKELTEIEKAFATIDTVKRGECTSGISAVQCEIVSTSLIVCSMVIDIHMCSCFIPTSYFAAGWKRDSGSWRGPDAGRVDWRQNFGRGTRRCHGKARCRFERFCRLLRIQDLLGGTCHLWRVRGTVGTFLLLCCVSDCAI